MVVLSLTLVALLLVKYDDVTAHMLSGRPVATDHYVIFATRDEPGGIGG